LTIIYFEFVNYNNFITWNEVLARRAPATFAVKNPAPTVAAASPAPPAIKTFFHLGTKSRIARGEFCPLAHIPHRLKR